MLSSALVVFREVLEAAIVVGIVLAATAAVARRNLFVGLGIGGGLACALLVAAFATAIAQAAAGMGQEIFNAGILFTAVLVLGWSIVWMRRHGRTIAAHVSAVGRGVAAGEAPLYMLSTVVGLAVLREGAETVLFLHGIAAQGTSGLPMLLGGLGGLLAGVVLGWLIYRGLLKIAARHLFGVTGWLLALLAAGMASQGASALVAADVLPSLGDAVWDTSAILSERNLLGQILHTLVGYDSRPAGIQLVFYVATLATIAVLMRLVDNKPPLRKGATAAAAVAAMLLAFPHSSWAGTKVYSPIVHYGEFGVENRGDYTVDKGETDDSELNGIHELEYGVTDWWHTAIFGQFRKTGAGPYDYLGTAWENIFQFFPQGEPWIDSGIYLEYKRGHDDRPDEFEGKVLLEKPLGPTVNTLNVIFEQQIGPHAEESAVFGYAFRTKWRLRPYFEPALEAFGEVGELGHVAPLSEQEHMLGPVLLGTLPLARQVAFYYELGWLFGLTDGTAAHTLKWLAELEFYF